MLQYEYPDVIVIEIFATVFLEKIIVLVNTFTQCLGSHVVINIVLGFVWLGPKTGPLLFNIFNLVNEKCDWIGWILI